MHTISGRRFEIGTKYAPTIHDIAVGLSRIPRWAGATIRGSEWSVLHHVLACGRLARRAKFSPEAVLFAYLHDMEEMATGDIPTPFKTEQQKGLERRLRRWMYKETVKRQYPTPLTVEAVKILDDRLKLAELLSFCHPNAWWDPYFRAEVLQFVNASPPHSGVMSAIDMVWDLADVGAREAIDLFTREVDESIEEVPVTSHRACDQCGYESPIGLFYDDATGLAFCEKCA